MSDEVSEILFIISNQVNLEVTIYINNMESKNENEIVKNKKQQVNNNEQQENKLERGTIC